MKTVFWQNIPHSSKIGEVQEDRHLRLLHNVLYDPNTYISTAERNSYILYDAQGTEALLFRPKSIISRIGMRLFSAMLNIFPKGEEYEED